MDVMTLHLANAHTCAYRCAGSTLLPTGLSIPRDTTRVLIT